MAASGAAHGGIYGERRHTIRNCAGQFAPNEGGAGRELSPLKGKSFRACWHLILRLPEDPILGEYILSCT